MPMKRYFADRNGMNLIRTAIALLAAAVICVAIHFCTDYPILLWSIMGGISGLGLFFILIYLPIFFRNAYYYVSSKEITKHSGFWFRRTQVMRMSAVQYTTAVLTPFSGFTGLNFLILNGYGGTIFAVSE